MILKLPKRVFFVFSAFLLPLIIPSRTLAAYNLLEHFTTNPSPLIWDVYNEANKDIIIDPGYLHIQPVDSHRSFFMQSAELLPIEGDVSISMKFKFISQAFGSGIAINDAHVVPRSYVDHSLSDYIFLIWPLAGNKYGLFTSLCLDTLPCNSYTQILQVEGVDFTQWHDLNIEYIDSKYYVYHDNVLLLDPILSSRKPVNYWFGNPQITYTSVDFTEMYIDYLMVESVWGELIFPYYSQLDPLWASDEYDSASSWAEEDQYGIGRWGCALTSAAMVFAHHEVNSPIDGLESTPKVLNEWLRAQPDGYVRNGLVNWIALTRYVREAEEAGHSPTKLEFTKKRNFDVNVLDLPTILGLPGHFWVAHDEDIDNFKINDPIDESNKSLAKTEDISSTNTFIPSSTDLSYFMFAVDDDVVVELVDENGVPVGTVYQEYLEDDVDHDESGEELQIVYLSKPASGTYRLIITNSSGEITEYDLDAYFYDEDGMVTIPAGEMMFSLLPGEEDIFRIVFDREEVEETGIVVSIASVRELVKNYRETEKIYNDGVAKALDNFLRYAERFENKGKGLSKMMLKLMVKYIERHTPRLIDPDAAEEILLRLNLYIED